MSLVLENATDVELAPLEELEVLLKDIPAAKERTFFGNALVKAYEQVVQSESLVELLREVEVYFAMCTKYLDLPEEVRTELKCIQQLGSRLSGVDSREDYLDVRHHVSNLEREIGALQRAVNQAFERMIQREFASIGALGAVLSKVDETRELGKRMEMLGRQAKEVSKRSTTQVVVEVERLRSERQVMRDELDSFGADEAVLAFLQDISQGALPLSRINGSVLPWLEQHHAVGLLTISLRA